MVSYRCALRTARGLRRALMCGAAAAFMAAGAGGAVAQEVEELVVTAPNYVPTTNLGATKIAIPLVETPQAVTVITRDQIDVLNVQNLQQAVRYSSGVVGENFGPDERYDWLTLRGFSPVEYIDGLQSPVGSVPNVGLDLWGAESVEILKGPSGVLYGQTPPGGIVNITLRRPQADLHGEIQGQLGSFDDRQIAGDVTGSLVGDGVLQGRLTALWRKRETQLDGTRSRRYYVAPALTWNVGADTQLTLLAYYQNDRAHGGDGGFLPAVGTLLPNPLGQIPVSFNAGEPDYNLFTRKQWGIGYEASHRFNDHLTLKQNLKFSRQDENFVSVYGAGLQADNRTLNRNNFIFPEDIRSFAVDTRGELTGSTGPLEHLLLVGVDYRKLKNNTDFEFGSAPPIDIFNPVYGQPIPAPFFVLPDYIDSTSKQTGLYAQDFVSAGAWRVTLSARQDWLRGVVHDDAFTYRAGVNYLFSSGLAPYVSYSTSFLPTNGADFSGNPFQPSKGEQFEAGLKYEPRNLPKDVRIFASAAVYDLTQKNVLTNDPDHQFFSVQTGEVEVKGVELEGVARIRERLSLNASYSYTDSEVTKSNGADLHKRLPIVPKHKASALADYTFQDGPLAGFGAGLGVRYLGSSYGDAANTLKSEDETLFDAIVHYDRDDWRLALNVTNIGDKVYVQRCSDLNSCFYSSRRTIVVTLGRKW
jgi:iron complex outermembrane recepter protein